MNKTMPTKRKPGPVRQQSLRSSSPRRTPALKKQLSIDSNKYDNAGPKVAWSDTTSVDLVAKKCTTEKPHTKPQINIHRQVSLERETILYTRQELAERLRKAWKEREKNKTGIDIYLTRNINEESQQDKDDTGDDSKSNANESHKTKPSKTISGLYNNKDKSEACMRIVRTDDENKSETYVPSSDKSNGRPKIVKQISIVISPISEFSEEVRDDESKLEQGDGYINNEIADKDRSQEPLVADKIQDKVNDLHASSNPKPCNNVVLTPAATKREGFQRHANKAFSGSVAGVEPASNKRKPALVRASSVDQCTISNNNKGKFTATKRRLKSANASSRRGRSGHQIGTESSSEEGEGAGGRRTPARCRSALQGSGGDVITLVSLTSPPTSDTEEDLVNTTVKHPLIAPDTKKGGTPSVKEIVQLPHPRIVNLRRTIKQVSFQHSGLTAIRNYTSSFPLRRGSIAPAGSLIPAGVTPQVTQQPTPSEISAAAANARIMPRKRLIRMKSAPLSQGPEDTINLLDPNSDPTVEFEELTQELTKEECGEKVEEPPKTGPQKLSKSKSADVDNDDESDEDPDQPKFETLKEKQCWKMYKKICEKGIPISFDTFLRGMLTPTEYRLRTKEVENDETTNVSETATVPETTVS